MSVYKHQRSPFYYFDFQRCGQRYRGSTGCTDRREAEAEERRLIYEAEKAAGPKGSRRRGLPNISLSMSLAADRYWEEVCAHGASPDADLSLLARLADLIGPTLDIRRVTDAELAAAVAKRRRQFRMPQAHRRVLR